MAHVLTTATACLKPPEWKILPLCCIKEEPETPSAALV